MKYLQSLISVLKTPHFFNLLIGGFLKEQLSKRFNTGDVSRSGDRSSVNTILV